MNDRSSRKFYFRLALGRFLIRLGAFIESLAVTVMGPDDLVALGRQGYSNTSQIDFWTKKNCVTAGLTSVETSLYEMISLEKGRLLVLCVGGGREAIFFAQRGFKVTGVDFVPQMVDKFKENAAAAGLVVDALVQDIAELQVSSVSFDVACLFSYMYSTIPTRKRRLLVLRRVMQALKPGGYFALTFKFNTKVSFCWPAEVLKQIVAFLSNVSYEKGDWLLLRAEFQHTFTSEKEIRGELEAGGFDVISIVLDDVGRSGGALLQRRTGEVVC